MTQTEAINIYHKQNFQHKHQFIQFEDFLQISCSYCNFFFISKIPIKFCSNECLLSYYYYKNHF
jgi:hypothetical protein